MQHLIRLLRNLGVMLVITGFAALLSSLIDPDHGTVTIGLYAIAWVTAFFLAGRAVPAMPWAHVFGTCVLFLAAGFLAGVEVTWKVVVFLILTAIAGGQLAFLANRRR